MSKIPGQVHATLIDDLLADDSLDDLRTLESVDAAFETLAPRLPGWGQARSGPPD